MMRFEGSFEDDNELTAIMSHKNNNLLPEPTRSVEVYCQNIDTFITNFLIDKLDLITEVEEE